MIEKMKALVQRKKSCVLATTDGEAPHCSLMAYAADETCAHLYVATPRDTLKYRNIRSHPRVSLLVDTRDEAGAGPVTALTITGECREVGAPETRALLAERLAARHPHLADFLRGEDMAFIRIAIRTFQLLKGPERAYHASLEDGLEDS